MLTRPESPEDEAAAAERKTLARAFAELDRAGVRWVLLRGGQPSGAEPDVDVLVGAESRTRLARVLAPAGFAEVPTAGRGTHRFFLAFVRSTGGWVKIDAVSELAFGRHSELRAPRSAAAACLSRRRRSRGVWLLDPRDGFWTLLVHCLLDKGRVPDRHRLPLRALADDASAGDDLAALAGAGRACSAPVLLAAARRGDWPALAAAAPPLRAEWERRARLRVSLRRSGARAARRLERLIGAPRRRGLVVAVPAPRVSSLASSLAAELPLPVRSLSVPERHAAPLAARLHAAGGAVVVVANGSSRTDLELPSVQRTSDAVEAVWRCYARLQWTR
jgi:hypothetical protein